MGACQNQFENVPELLSDPSPEYQRQQNRFSINSINLEHKAARANTQHVTIGLIDTKLQSYKSQQFLNTKFNQFGTESIQFSPIKSTVQERTDSVMKPFLKGKQIDRQQLHGTQRPFMQSETVALVPQENVMKINRQRNREALDLTFYYSLGLPQYAYKPIQQKYMREFQNLIVCEQQQRNGVKYIGEWKDRKTVHGNGVMQSNTTKYIGQFMNGLKHFHGREIQKYQVYQGQFESGRRKGYGVKYTQQSVEQGTFDEYLTEGTINYSNGNKYQGVLKNNLYHGKGTFTDMVNHIVYEGNFQNGKLNGKGKILSYDEVIYEGLFKQGLKHGNGKFNWGPEEYYVGQYSRGKKHGVGRLRKNDIIYEGQFINGKMNGDLKMLKLKNDNWEYVKTLQFKNGVRVIQEQSSIFSDDGFLPRQWKQAIQKKEQVNLLSNQESSFISMNRNFSQNLPKSNIISVNSNPIQINSSSKQIPSSRSNIEEREKLPISQNSNIPLLNEAEIMKTYLSPIKDTENQAAHPNNNSNENFNFHSTPLYEKNDPFGII